MVQHEYHNFLYRYGLHTCTTVYISQQKLELGSDIFQSGLTIVNWGNQSRRIPTMLRNKPAIHCFCTLLNERELCNTCKRYSCLSRWWRTAADVGDGFAEARVEGAHVREGAAALTPGVYQYSSRTVSRQFHGVLRSTFTLRTILVLQC